MNRADVPQANSLPKVRRVVEAVARPSKATKARIAKAASLEPRHVDYYLRAARTLGLLRKEGDRLLVTDRGRQLLGTRPGSELERDALRDAITESEIGRELVPQLLAPSGPSRAQVIKAIQRAGAAESVARRRASTLLAWRKYLVGSRQQDLDLDGVVRDKPGVPYARVAPKPSPEPPPAYLTSLTLQAFKGFRTAKLDLGAFTVVLGTNASGKSNLRDAFRFLHGIARGYTLAEIIGEKWIEGGVLQWKGLRGGSREVAYAGSTTFALEAGLRMRDGNKERDASYRIEVTVPDPRGAPRVVAERLVVTGRGQYVFDSHPPTNTPRQDDPTHLAVRLKKKGSGFIGREIRVLSSRPALSQIPEHRETKPREIRDLCEAALGAFSSMRFLDLSPDAMRLPSLPGQVVLGDRGENLSSVLQAICEEPATKSTLADWLRELTPLDVVDFEFPADQTGRVLVTLVEEGARKTSAYSASDGTLRFLAMVAAFLGPDPAHFYFFEELETGLHPTRLHLLLSLVEQETGRGATQVVATTHSPQLLGLLSRETIEHAVLTYRLPRRADQQVIRLLDLPDAKRVLETQDVAHLFRTGWLEDAVVFGTEGDE